MRVKRRAHEKKHLSSFIARVLRRLGGVLCSPCVPDIHRLVHIPGQCNCTLLSAPLLMRAWHSLHITIKAQTQKYLVHWSHLLRAFPEAGESQELAKGQEAAQVLSERDAMMAGLLAHPSWWRQTSWWFSRAAKWALLAPEQLALPDPAATQPPQQGKGRKGKRKNGQGSGEAAKGRGKAWPPRTQLRQGTLSSEEQERRGLLGVF